MITDLTAKRIKALSQRQTYLRVLRTRWRQKSTVVDMEQNYVAVTLCIHFPVVLYTEMDARCDKLATVELS